MRSFLDEVAEMEATPNWTGWPEPDIHGPDCFCGHRHGCVSLWQTGRLNASTQAIYEREYAAGQAAEQVRSLALRASRAQTQLLTAPTVAERNGLGKDIDTRVADITRRTSTFNALSSATEELELSQQLTKSIGNWSKRVQAYVELVKAHPLDLIKMSAEVPGEDAGLLNDTRKLEKLVDGLVGLRSTSAQATIVTAGNIYATSQVWLADITLALAVLSACSSTCVSRRLAYQLGGEPA
jgi:methyl-accepting chemotaxis protein